MTNDVRQVVERLRERHAEMCDETDGMESGDAEVLRLAADLLVKLTSPPAPSGWQQRIAAISKKHAAAVMEDLPEHATDDAYAEMEAHFLAALAEVWNAKDALPPASSLVAEVERLRRALVSCRIMAGDTVAAYVDAVLALPPAPDAKECS